MAFVKLIGFLSLKSRSLISLRKELIAKLFDLFVDFLIVSFICLYTLSMLIPTNVALIATFAVIFIANGAVLVIYVRDWCIYLTEVFTVLVLKLFDCLFIPSIIVIGVRCEMLKLL